MLSNVVRTLVGFARHDKTSNDNPSQNKTGQHEARCADMYASVLRNEPFLVIEPSTRIGLTTHISGIADNFQLQMVLMDVFPGAPNRRIAPAHADCAWGRGPQQLQGHVTGAWSMFDASSQKIWGEGTPSDIPRAHSFRVVVLAAPEYSHSWSANRMFPDLKVHLDNTTILHKAEVERWMDFLALR
jgi:hypothetical protein